MIPCPDHKTLQLLLKAYDLNPLLMLNLRDVSHSCQAMTYVSPRRNKCKKSLETHIPFEVVYTNLSMRDTFNQAKQKVVKIVHAIVNRKIFIFYNRQTVFDEIFDCFEKQFGFRQKYSTSFMQQTYNSKMSLNKQRKSVSKIDALGTNDPIVTSDIFFAIFNLSL